MYCQTIIKNSDVFVSLRYILEGLENILQETTVYLFFSERKITFFIIINN